MNYKIFFDIDGTNMFLAAINDNLICDWCFEQEESLDFDEEHAQPLLDILQAKYPHVTFQTTFFL